MGLDSRRAAVGFAELSFQLSAGLISFCSSEARLDSQPKPRESPGPQESGLIGAAFSCRAVSMVKPEEITRLGSRCWPPFACCHLSAGSGAPAVGGEGVGLADKETAEAFLR